MIVDTDDVHRGGSAAGASDFFNQRAMEHISKCFELMRALDLPFNLRTAYNLLVNKDHLKNTLDTVPDHPRAKELLPLVQHFETFYLNLKSEGQSEGELGTIGNFLAPYQHPAVAEVFCSDQPDTITINQVDQGNVLVLNLRNRMIFRAADAECAKQSAEFIGKKIVNKRSRSVGSRGVTYSYQETEEYKVKPHQLREMPVYRTVLVHAGRPGQFKRVSLRMLTGTETRKHYHDRARTL